MATIKRADIYLNKWPNGQKITDETSAINASGASGLNESRINNSQIFIAFVLMLVAIRFASDMLPSA